MMDQWMKCSIAPFSDKPKLTAPRECCLPSMFVMSQAPGRVPSKYMSRATLRLANLAFDNTRSLKNLEARQVPRTMHWWTACSRLECGSCATKVGCWYLSSAECANAKRLCKVPRSPTKKKQQHIWGWIKTYYIPYLRGCTCIYELSWGFTRVPGFWLTILGGETLHFGSWFDSCPFWAAAKMHKTSPSLQWIFTGLPPFSEGASEQPALMGNSGIIIGILGEVRHIMVKPRQFLNKFPMKIHEICPHSGQMTFPCVLVCVLSQRLVGW